VASKPGAEIKAVLSRELLTCGLFSDSREREMESDGFNQ